MSPPSLSISYFHMAFSKLVCFSISDCDWTHTNLIKALGINFVSKEADAACCFLNSASTIHTVRFLLLQVGIA